MIMHSLTLTKVASGGIHDRAGDGCGEREDEEEDEGEEEEHRGRERAGSVVGRRPCVLCSGCEVIYNGGIAGGGPRPLREYKMAEKVEERERERWRRSLFLPSLLFARCSPPTERETRRGDSMPKCQSSMPRLFLPPPVCVPFLIFPFTWFFLAIFFLPCFFSFFLPPRALRHAHLHACAMHALCYTRSSRSSRSLHSPRCMYRPREARPVGMHRRAGARRTGRGRAPACSL